MGKVMGESWANRKAPLGRWFTVKFKHWTQQWRGRAIGLALGIGAGGLGAIAPVAAAAAAEPPTNLEEQAARHLVTIVRVQRAFYEQKGRFAADLTELARVGSGWPDPPETGTYRYRVTLADGLAIAIADPNGAELRGLRADLRTAQRDDGTGAAIGRLCITANPGEAGVIADRRFANPDQPCAFSSR